jgi:hypothetical protein
MYAEREARLPWFHYDAWRRPSATSAWCGRRSLGTRSRPRPFRTRYRAHFPQPPWQKRIFNSPAEAGIPPKWSLKNGHAASSSQSPMSVNPRSARSCLPGRPSADRTDSGRSPTTRPLSRTHAVRRRDQEASLSSSLAAARPGSSSREAPGAESMPSSAWQQWTTGERLAEIGKPS